MPLYGKIVVIRRNGTDGSQFPLTSSSCLFGRSLECDIRVQLPYVSNEQCKLEISEKGEFLLHNLSTANETIVNGKSVKGTISVKNNDVFTLVDRSFRFELPDNAAERIGTKRASLGLKDTKRNALQSLDQNRESNNIVAEKQGLKDEDINKEKIAPTQKTPKRKSISKPDKLESGTKENTPAKVKTPKRKSISAIHQPEMDSTSSEENAKEKASAKVKTPKRKSVTSVEKQESDMTSLEESVKTSAKENTSVRTPKRKSISAFEEYQESIQTENKATPKLQTPTSMSSTNVETKLNESPELKNKKTPQRRTSPRISTASNKEFISDVNIPKEDINRTPTLKTPKRKSMSKNKNSMLGSEKLSSEENLDVVPEPKVVTVSEDCDNDLTRSETLLVEVAEKTVKAVTPKQKTPMRKSISSAKKISRVSSSEDDTLGDLTKTDTPTSKQKTPRRKSITRGGIKNSMDLEKVNTPQDLTPKSESFASEESSIPDFSVSRKLIETVTPPQSNTLISDSESSLTSMDVEEFVRTKTSNQKTPRRKSIPMIESLLDFDTSGDLINNVTPKRKSLPVQPEEKCAVPKLEEAEVITTPKEKRKSASEPFPYVPDFYEAEEDVKKETSKDQSSLFLTENVTTSFVSAQNTPQEVVGRKSIIDSPQVLSIKRKSIREMGSAKIRNWSPLPKVNEVENNSSPRKRPASLLKRLSNVGPTSVRKSRRVSFGPQLSPEQFLLTLPTNTPVKRGAIPPLEAALKEEDEEETTAIATRSPTPFKPNARKSRTLFQQAVCSSMRTRSSPPEPVKSVDPLAANLNKEFLQCSPTLKSPKRTPTSNRPIVKRRSSGLWSQVVKRGRKTVGKQAAVNQEKVSNQPKKNKRHVKTPKKVHHIDSPATIYIGKTRRRVQVLKTPKPSFATKQQKLNLPLNESLTGVGDMFQTPEPSIPDLEACEIAEEEFENEVYVDKNGSYTEEINSTSNDDNSVESSHDTSDREDDDDDDEISHENHDTICGDIKGVAHEKNGDEVHENHDEYNHETISGNVAENPPNLNTRSSPRLLANKKQKTQPVEDNFGLQRLVKTPLPKKVKSQPVEDQFGVRKLMTTPKPRPAKSQPVEDQFSVRKLIATPKPRPAKSQPVQDQFGVRKLMTTPKPRPAKSLPVEDQFGVRKLMTTPKPRPVKSKPVENQFGLRKLMTTPKPRAAKSQPVEHQFGLRKLMTTPKQRPAKSQPVEDHYDIAALYETPKISVRNSISKSSLETEPEKEIKKESAKKGKKAKKTPVKKSADVRSTKNPRNKTSAQKLTEESNQEVDAEIVPIQIEKEIVEKINSQENLLEKKTDPLPEVKDDEVVENTESLTLPNEDKSILPTDNENVQSEVVEAPLPIIITPEPQNDENMNILPVDNDKMILLEPEVLKVEITNTLKRKVTFHESVYSPAPKVAKKSKGRKAAPKKKVDVTKLVQRRTTRSKDRSAATKVTKPAKKLSKVAEVETTPVEEEDVVQVPPEVKEPEKKKPARQTRGKKRKNSGDEESRKKPALEKTVEAIVVPEPSVVEPVPVTIEERVIVVETPVVVESTLVTTKEPIPVVEKPARKTRARKNNVVAKSQDKDKETKKVEVIKPTRKTTRSTKLTKTDEVETQVENHEVKEPVEIPVEKKDKKVAADTKKTTRGTRFRKTDEVETQVENHKVEAPVEILVENKDQYVVAETKKTTRSTRANRKTVVEKTPPVISKEPVTSDEPSAETVEKTARKTRGKKNDPVHKEEEKLVEPVEMVVDVKPTRKTRGTRKTSKEQNKVEPAVQTEVQDIQAEEIVEVKDQKVIEKTNKPARRTRTQKKAVVDISTVEINEVKALPKTRSTRSNSERKAVEPEAEKKSKVQKKTTKQRSKSDSKVTKPDEPVVVRKSSRRKY